MEGGRREVDECGCSRDFHQKGVYIEPETGSTLIRCLCCFSFLDPLALSLSVVKRVSLSRFFYLLRLSSVEKRGALVCIIRSVAIDTNCPYREKKDRKEEEKKKDKMAARVRIISVLCSSGCLSLCMQYLCCRYIRPSHIVYV